MSKIDPADGRTTAMKLAHGIMWFLIWMGFGGCYMLSSRDKSAPLIQITIRQK